MATRLKPTRINVDNTPRVGDGASYQTDDNFRWSAGGGDMSYRDFEWVTLTGNSLVIEDISNNVTPTGDFTVTAGTLKPGIEYVLRVNTGNTPYTMTLGTGVTNPNSYKTELKPNTVNQFKFIATSTNQLELEGVDSAVVSEINWGEIDGTLSDQTDLQNALDAKQNILTAGQGIDITNNQIRTTLNYGVSDTAASTVQKEVSIPSITELNVGQVIIVKPTVTSTAVNSTLKLNDFPAYAMLYNAARITSSSDSIVWSANVPSMFYLDEYNDVRYWRFLGHGLDTGTNSVMSVSEGQTGTLTTGKLISANNLKQIIKYHAVDNSQLGDVWNDVKDIAPSEASMYFEFTKRNLQAGTNLEILPNGNHNLPEGYIELDYLGVSGSGYIDTGNILKCKDTFKIRFKRPTATTPSGTQRFFGSAQNSNSIPRISLGFRTAGFVFGGVNATVDFLPIDTDIHTVEVGYDGTDYYYKVDNGDKTTYTPTSTTEPSINAYIFAGNGSTVTYSGGIRIYYLEWHREDGTEVAHLIPAQRDSDGVLGMYDLVSDTFLAPAGSGTWSGAPLGQTINFTNDSGFITNSVNNLVNYYLKSETYTQSEVNSLIGSIQQFHYEIYPSIGSVTTPATNVLYLIGPSGTGSDQYEEYVYANNNFVKIGDTSIDLSGYVTTSALNTAFANYTLYLTTLLAGKQDTLTAGTGIGINGTTINNTGVLSVNGQTGNVTMSGLPSGGVNGQVLMMVNGTPTWVTPADNGFVMQALNSPIAIKYIWAGQQSAYDGLSSYDDNTHYDTI